MGLAVMVKKFPTGLDTGKMEKAGDNRTIQINLIWTIG
jgi:hypothetical protein